MEVPEDGAEGIIFAIGGDAAGWSVFGWEGKMRFHYDFFGFQRDDIISPAPLLPGKHTVKVSITPETEQPAGRRAGKIEHVTLDLPAVEPITGYERHESG